MIENYLLEYLVAFYQLGTLSDVANQMNVSPASVSRGLTKLEKSLNVKLFIRQPQKLVLTSTGKFAAQQAISLLVDLNNFPQKIMDFSKNKQSIHIGGTIPGPLLLLCKFYKYPGSYHLNFNHQMLLPENVQKLLLNNQYTFIITTQSLKSSLIDSKLLGKESLAIKVTKQSRFYNQQHVSFNQLHDRRFVVAPNIGEWKSLIEKQIPNAHFLYQMESSYVHELTKNSIFPLFRTNITHYLESFNPIDLTRKYIPISDSSAQLPIYAIYKKEDCDRIKPLIKWLKSKLNTIT